MAGLLGGIAGAARVTEDIATEQIKRQDMDIRDAALFRKQKSLAELQNRLTAGREETARVATSAEKVKSRAATAEEKKTQREFDKPLQTARIGLLEAQKEKAKQPKALSTADRKFAASQSLERIDAEFKHSGVELMPNEAGTIEGVATAEQLKSLAEKANREGFDLITSNGELLDSGYLAAFLGKKATQLINFTVVPSEGGPRKRQPGPSTTADRLRGYIGAGKTTPASPKTEAPSGQGSLIGPLSPSDAEILKRRGEFVGGATKAVGKAAGAISGAAGKAAGVIGGLTGMTPEQEQLILERASRGRREGAELSRRVKLTR